MAHKDGDCYIDVWREADFRGETLRIYGPAQYPSLDMSEGRWGDDIGSLRVGPNDEVADLGQFKFDDDIESLNLIDSLKIFDRLAYNAALAPESPAAAPTTAPATSPSPSPDKGKRWKGKKH